MTSERHARDFAEKETEAGPDDCNKFFEEVKDGWSRDPNNVIYNFVTSVDKRIEKDPAEYSVLKRRQRTKDGNESPKNPCDDKGKPLFKTPSGELVAKAEGNEVAWGPWLNALRDDVSMETITKPERCRGHRMLGFHWYGAPSREDQIKDAIDRDTKMHDKQQEKKASKVAVDYKYELAKEAGEHPVWTCKVVKEKAREFPETWKDVAYHPNDAPGKSPIFISFSYDKRVQNEKTGGFKTVHTGVGNFKGRERVTGEIGKGSIFGLRALEDGLKKAGFKRPPYGFSDEDSTLKVPDSDDVCMASVSRRDFPYAANGWVNRRLEDEQGRVYLGGMFRSAQFSIAKELPRATFHDKFQEYEEKAPGKSVAFCHEKFNEAVKDAIVNLE
jgi:hypothetical protein